MRANTQTALPGHSLDLLCRNDAQRSAVQKPWAISYQNDAAGGEMASGEVLDAPSFTFNDLPPYNPPIPR
jgi:hypothetical protein